VTDTAALIYVDRDAWQQRGDRRELRPFDTVEWPELMPEAHRQALYSYHAWTADWRVTMGFNTMGIIGYVAAVRQGDVEDTHLPAIRELVELIARAKGEPDHWASILDTAYGMAAETRREREAVT
jgi:hypothetical protein